MWPETTHVSSEHEQSDGVNYYRKRVKRWMKRALISENTAFKQCLSCLRLTVMQVHLALSVGLESTDSQDLDNHFLWNVVVCAEVVPQEASAGGSQTSAQRWHNSVPFAAERPHERGWSSETHQRFEDHKLLHRPRIRPEICVSAENTAQMGACLQSLVLG